MMGLKKDAEQKIKKGIYNGNNDGRPRDWVVATKLGIDEMGVYNHIVLRDLVCDDTSIYLDSG